MNITEADAVNTLLAWITTTAPACPPGMDEDDWLLAQDDDAKQAAKVLADRAHQALSAGITGADVEAAWEHVCIG